MSSQDSSVHVVTVSSTPAEAKGLIGAVIKTLKDNYNIVHVANSETLSGIKTLLTSLVIPPRLLITTSEWFEEEQEEVREIAQKLQPDLHLITIPPGLKAQEGDKVVVEYLTEQITESKLPVRSAV